MAKKQRPWSIKDGQMDFEGNVIRVCDVCGRINTSPGRHPRCEQKIPRAAELAKRWAMRAMQKEVATKKPQQPPRSLSVLCRIAGVKIDAIAGAIYEQSKKSTQVRGGK